MRSIVNFASNLKNNIYAKNLPDLNLDTQTMHSNGTIIIITTTAGGDEINSQTVQLVRNSPARSMPQPSQLDMGRVVKSSPLLEDFSEMLTSRGVTLNVVPFMPLSRGVVRNCIVNELKRRFPEHEKLTYSRKIIDDLIQEIKFFSDEFPVFSTSGCN